MSFLLVAILAVAPLTTCKKDTSPGQAASPPSAQERSYRELLLGELAAEASRAAPRPVLRGTAIAGAAAPELAALADPMGPFKECLAFLAAKRQDVNFRDLFLWGARAMKLPRRTLGYALPLDEAPPASPLLAELRRVCGALPAALAKAVAHGGGASPFVPGKRNDVPAHQLLLVGRAASALCRLEGAGPLLMAQCLLDVVRYGQDMGRGAVPVMIAKNGVEASLAAVPHLEEILASARLGASDLAALQRELDVLARGENDPRLNLRGSRLAAELHVLCAPLEGPGFQPPGGPLSSTLRQAIRAGKGAGSGEAGALGAAERVGVVAAWGTSRVLARAREAACADALSLAECASRLSATANAPRKPKSFPGESAQADAEWYFDLLCDLGVSSRTELVNRAFYIDAMRLHVAARITARKGEVVGAEQLLKLAKGYGTPWGAPSPSVRDLGDGFVVEPAGPVRGYVSRPLAYRVRLPAKAAAAQP